MNKPTTARLPDEVGFFVPCRPIRTGCWGPRRNQRELVLNPLQFLNYERSHPTKKRIVMLVCAAVLTLGLTTAPAMASAGPFTPVEVEAYTYGPLDELRINKIYRLSATDDPSGIPTEDFERGGRRYYLLNMISANTDHETVTYTAVFGSVELARATDPQAFDGTDGSLGLLLVLSFVGGVIIVAANIKYKGANQCE